MMKKSSMLVVFIALLVIGSCSKNKTEDTIDKDTPSERSFLMGFTPFPYDITLEAQNQSYQYALQNGDVVLAHFDHGVPWNEALNGLPFPTEVQNAIDGTKSIKTTNNKIVLTATPMSINRNGLANYWNDSGAHQELPAPWNGYSFDNADVISAYLNYCKRIIDEIQPDYFAYGIEVNAELTENSDAFNEYLVLVDSVYNSLKQDYPELPIFLTFQDQSFNKTLQELHQLTKTLLNYSDLIAVSTYPFWQYNFPSQDANPSLFSDDWLKEMRDLAPNKPFAISETGYIAEDLDLSEVNVNIKGSPEWQSDYLKKLFIASNELDAEFVLWFIYRDYDLLYNNTPNPPTIFKIWRDNGLLDGDGNRRTAHDLWDTWRELPHK